MVSSKDNNCYVDFGFQNERSFLKIFKVLKNIITYLFLFISELYQKLFCLIF